jgi:hypothetical protein
MGVVLGEFKKRWKFVDKYEKKTSKIRTKRKDARKNKVKGAKDRETSYCFVLLIGRQLITTTFINQLLIIIKTEIIYN